MFSSCSFSENILQSSSEVDFSIPRKVQIKFNENIYNTLIFYNNSKLEINFEKENNIMSDAFVCITGDSYKILYKDMTFTGEKSFLTTSFLPCIIYSFFNSFESNIVLDTFDKDRNCHYTKRNIDGYFVVLEGYEKEAEPIIYSLEIK